MYRPRPRPRATTEQIGKILALARQVEWVTNDGWEPLRAHIWATYQVDVLEELTPTQAGAVIKTLRQTLGV